MIATSASAAPKQEPAKFDWFEYDGHDGLPKPGPSEYANPILQGFYPDPSILRVGRDYYLVNSTFAWFPGMPVFHSRDLVHWTQVGNAIDRPAQLDLSKTNSGLGLYAPDISFHGGKFYILNTCVACGGNFVITASRPEGPWSDPVWLPDVDGIDSSLFFDDDGTAWIVHNGPPPEKPKYAGHTAIWLQQFDSKTLKTFGKPELLIDQGTHPERNPIWIEGPHVFKKDGLYYLIAAEGGTAEQHSEVVFRSDKVTGPYQPLESNPILTQRDLPDDRPDPITSTGHAKFVDTPNGEWWAVFLGVRPYDAAGDFNTGRETFMMRVRWENGWPRITEPGQRVPWVAAAPNLPRQARTAVPLNGDFKIREEFNSSKLPLYWMQLRNPDSKWWRIRNGALEVDPRPVELGAGGNPSLLARRQQHLNSTASTQVRFRPSSDDSEAGLVAMQNDDHWYFISVGSDRGKAIVRVYRRAGGAASMLASELLGVAPGSPVQLRISAHRSTYDFSWRTGGRHWRTLVKQADGTILSTKKAGGFVGAVFALYAHGGKDVR